MYAFFNLCFGIMYTSDKVHLQELSRDTIHFWHNKSILVHYDSVYSGFTSIGLDDMTK